MAGLTEKLQDALRQAELWPEEMQAELADASDEIAAGLNGDYAPSQAELAGIDRGIADAEQGRFASDDRLQSAWEKFQRS